MKATFLTILTLFLSCALLAQERNNAIIGAEACPDTIAPITAPFDMPQLQRPVFLDNTVRIDKAGAKQGKKNICTRYIQRAIDKVAKKGGGVVVVPKGHWLTGRVELKSGTCLHLEEGAELEFSDRVEDYLPAVFTRSEGIELYSCGACVYARDARNIAITGKGTLVGPSKESPLYDRRLDNMVIEDFIDMHSSVESRVYEDSVVFLPEFFNPVNCTNVLVEGVSFKNAVYWNIVPTYCDSVIIRGVTVEAEGGRTDGIDIESTRNVLIEYVTLSTGDDCFTLKSGRCEDGLRVNKPTENVVIRHCYAKEGVGGMTCGSETAGWVRNVYVHDCVIGKASEGIYLKSRRNRGGGVENLYFDNLVMQNPKRAIKIDMLGVPMYVGELAERWPAREKTPLIPTFRNFQFHNLTIDKCQKLFSLKGLPESLIEDFAVDGLKANYDEYGTLQDVGTMWIK